MRPSDASSYESVEGDRYRSTGSTAGPWNPSVQHGGPPAALLGRPLESIDEGAPRFRQTHSPTGGRTTCPVSSVFMKLHRVTSREADAPDAESPQMSGRWSGLT